MATFTNSEGKPHFATLDGLRGIAALAVIILHWLEGLGYKPFGSSILAVDFFFMLSGFVVAYSYEDRLKKGYSFVKFMLLRVIRLYPMIVLGAMLGFIRFEAKHYFEVGTFSVDYCINLLLTLLMIPQKVASVEGMWSFFKLNMAFWSLYFEFIAYFLFGLVLYRLNKFILSVIAIFAFVGFGVWLKGSFEYRPQCSTIDALSRVIFSFVVGMLFLRYRLTLARLGKNIPVYALVLLPLLFCLPRNFMAWYVYLLLVVIIFPISIMVGMNHKFEGKAARSLNFLGEISYPVYAIHTPIIWMLGFAVKKITGITNPDQLVWFGLIILPVTLALSYLALKRYDEPLRQALKHRFSAYLSAP